MEARENVKGYAAAKVLDFILKGFVNFGILGVRIIAHFLNLTILLLSDIVEKLFLEDWDWWQSKYYGEDEDEEEKYQIEILESSNSTKHEYKMQRSKEFTKLYNDLRSNIDVTSEYNSLTLDKKLSEDIVQKIDRIIYQVEREALQQGYKFAKSTNNELELEDIYRSFIVQQIMSGK